MQDETSLIEKCDIKSLLPNELESRLSDMGQPAYRSKQVFKWLSSGICSFDEMLNIPKSLRSELDKYFFLTSPSVVRKQVSKIDGTIKYLWGLNDGNCIESVVMKYAHGNTICVSSQVGCAMGCAFCASTIGGKIRNLLPSEILDQVIFSQIDSGYNISNIVLMGIGEPLDNFDNVIKFLRLVNCKDGLNIGMRHISLSTCGLAEKVDKLAELNLQLTLSVSLHAPDDDTRTKIMPVNKAYNVDKVLDSCRRYFLKTGRRISFEYAMIKDVNDTPYHARLLSQKLSGSGSHVNLISLNEVKESQLHPSTPDTVRRFIEILRNHNINVTIRRKLGPDIDASCGQLRRNEIGAFCDSNI